MRLVPVLSVAFRALAVSSVVACSHVSAADLRVLAPNAAKEAVTAAISSFEKSSGHTVTISWTGTEAITKRIGEGEVVDVVVNAAQNIDRLTADGKLTQGTRTDFARSSIGVAIAPSATRPNVSSVDELKSALLAAKSIVISSGTSGRYLADLFARLGVAEQIKAKVKQTPSGALVGDLLAAGEAELGFQQVSELINVNGIQYLGPIPAEIQSYTVYSAAIHSQSTQADLARSLLKALRQPEAAAAAKKSGLEPL